MYYWKKIIKFSIVSLFSLFLGSQCVHLYYKPMADFEDLIQLEIEELMRLEEEEDVYDVPYGNTAGKAIIKNTPTPKNLEKCPYCENIVKLRYEKKLTQFGRHTEPEKTLWL